MYCLSPQWLPVEILRFRYAWSLWIHGFVRVLNVVSARVSVGPTLRKNKTK
jgi:hypothetical protein